MEILSQSSEALTDEPLNGEPLTDEFSSVAPQDSNRHSVVHEKWGDAPNAGFQVIPDVLMKQQHALGLTATDLVVLLNLTMQWWYADKLPFPKTSTIANRMGASPRTIQRSLEHIEKLGLLRKVKRGQGKSLAFDLTPLAARLQPLARRDPSYRNRPRVMNGDSGVQTQSRA